jgi:hypothetical protein
MKDAGHDWVLVTDSDEFTIFNYIHEDEDPTGYNLSGVLNQTRSKEDIDAARRSAPIRRRLPPLEEHVTIADFIHAEKGEKCYRLPSLNFSAHQDEMTRVELPPASGVLLSLLQHRTGRMDGGHSSMILDVSKLDGESLYYPRPVGVDNPDIRALDCNGASDSNADTIGSVLRINHYSAGSAERYAESFGDSKGATFQDFLNNRHFNPVSENRDVDYWIDWFIKKVGIAEADRILFKPIVRTHQELAHVFFVKNLKSKMTDMGILPKKAAATAVIDDEGEVDEEGEYGV